MGSTPQLCRANVVDEQFIASVKTSKYPEPKFNITPFEADLSKSLYLDLFHSQLVSRHLDLQARRLKDRQQGFYSIGSSGHEGNAAMGLVFGLDDLAFLHYRSSAFVVQRSKKIPTIDPIYDQLLSLVASKEDPISGGRHKVFGSKVLNIPPQTSTIASHLPKAVGAALGLALKATSKKNHKTLSSVIFCSFGDGSANHSTALGAFNAAAWAVQQKLKMPLVFVCEDNGLAISVPTPSDWIEKQYSKRWGLHYISCDGRNLADVYQKSLEARTLASHGQPVFLHMKTVRLLGHAGSDIEFQYQSLQAIEAREKDDPLLHSARMIEQAGWLKTNDIVDLYETIRSEVADKADKALRTAKLTNAEAILASINPPRSSLVLPKPPSIEQREKVFGAQYLQLTQPKNLCQNINFALTDLMLTYPSICVFGEDVAKKGGVYRVTQDLQKRFGPVRVFDTLLDEQTILGTAIGFAHTDWLPIPEIQFLAYTHNAIDQIRGEAATLPFFSNGQFTNPMVIRIAGLAYQKGFGGHFHNDNALSFLREIPGIVIACPSRASDGAKLLRTCIDLAYQYQKVVIFLEPIALYMAKDLYKDGDKLALEPYPEPSDKTPIGEVGVEGAGQQIAIISYGNGAFLSRQAEQDLSTQGIDVKLIDLKWLHPFPEDSLRKALIGIQKVLVVDECRKTGSISEQIVTWMVETMDPVPDILRVTAEDCFIPIGEAWQYLLPSKDSIVQAVKSLCQNPNLKTQVL